MGPNKEHWCRGDADSSTTKLYSDNSLKSDFSAETITVEFGCSKANRPKVLADQSANIVFAYTYMDPKDLLLDPKQSLIR